MKVLALIVSCLLILNLGSLLEARLLLTNGNGFYCLWNTKRTCSKTTPTCVRIATNADATTFSCKYYKSQCQFMLDTCKGTSIYGTVGESVDAQMYCAGKSITIGSTGVCT
ncbi:hypothetical protein KR074_005478 [Drosophila pseudoananassae]|nr:hypothetical protein KR074_005478 [Drosophila pseudoananassae]